MKDRKKADLSAIDPVSTEPGWQGMLSDLADRAYEARRNELTVSRQIFSWAAPVAAGALMLILAGGGLLFSLQEKTTGETTAHKVEPGYRLMAWSSTNELPSTQAIIETFEGAQ